MASSSNPVKPAITQKSVNTELDMVAEGLKTLRANKAGSPNSHGVFEWDMVDLVDNLEGFRLDEGVSSEPKPSQESEWLVVDSVPIPKAATEKRQPGVVPEQPYMGNSNATVILAANDRRVQAAVQTGQVAGNNSKGKKSRRNRKRKKKEEKFFPHAPHHFFKKNKELICWVCGQMGHAARMCMHRKGRGGSGQSKTAYNGLGDSSSSGGLLVG